MNLRPWRQSNLLFVSPLLTFKMLVFANLTALYKCGEFTAQPKLPNYRKNGLNLVSYPRQAFKLKNRQIKISLGSQVKAWFKKASTIKQNQIQGFWSNNHYLKNRIGRVIFGWGQRIKPEINLCKQRNQQFDQIPTAIIKQRIQQLCQKYSIEFQQIEAVNTSVASLVDGETLPKHCKKPDNGKSSRCRTQSELFRTAMNWYINADCHGVAKSISKVSTTLELNLSGVSRGALTHSTRIYIWVTAKNKQSNIAQASCIVPA